MSYCTIEDIIALRGPQTVDDIEKLKSIIPVIESQFNLEAKSHGKDLRKMVDLDGDLAEVTKCLVCDAALTYLYSAKSTDAPMTQMAQAAGGYSISGTFSNPGGGLYSKKMWLKLLGIDNQRVGTIEPFKFGGDCCESY